MKNRKLIFSAVILLAIVLLGWLLYPREPVYQGKSLSAWLKEQHDYADKYDGRAIEAGIKASDAVHQIGSNALPVLVRHVAAKDSPLKMRIRWLQAKLKIPSHWITARERHEMAKFGFAALRAEGAPAVPDLIPLLSDKDPDVRSTAAICLCLIGPPAGPAVPALLKCLNDPQFNPRNSAMLALGSIRAQPAVVVPALIKNLSRARGTALDLESTLNALRLFGPEAKSASSNIFQLTSDSDASIRATAVSTLQAIDPEAAAKIKIPVENEPPWPGIGR